MARLDEITVGKFSGDTDRVGTLESIFAGVVSGAIAIPKGFFSLGATLIDLGAGTNKAAEVEAFFDDLTDFDEKAEATAAGKLTEVLVNIGIPAYADSIDTVYKQISTDQPAVKSILETIKKSSANMAGKQMKPTPVSHTFSFIKSIKRSSRRNDHSVFIRYKSRDENPTIHPAIASQTIQFIPLDVHGADIGSLNQPIANYRCAIMDQTQTFATVNVHGKIVTLAPHLPYPFNLCFNSTKR